MQLRNNYVYLLLRKRKVGTAKLFTGTASSPMRKIHGHSLEEFANRGETLVAVYHVQIFKESEQANYPFKYKDFDDPPSKLGDLNNKEKNFRSIIAWDLNQTMPNPHGCDLSDHPKVVSASHEYRDTPASAAGVCAGLQHSINGVDGQVSSEKDFLNTILDADDEDDGGRNMIMSCSEEDVDAVLASDSNNQFLDMATAEAMMDVVEEEEDAGESTDREEVIDLIDREDENDAVRENTELNSSLSMSSRSDSGESSNNEHQAGTVMDPIVLPENGPQISRRPYTYRRRQRATGGVSNLRLKRTELSRRADNPFNKRRKCCKRKCFDQVNSVFAFAKYRKLMAAGSKDRKEELIRLFNPQSRKFRFEGIDVCVAFMEKGFGFSRDLQNSVKKNPGARASCTAMRMPRWVKKDTKGDSIITFLEKIASETGDDMPNREHTQLPMLCKKDVYGEFIEYVQREHPRNHGTPTLSYFYFVWSKFCKHIKTHRYHGFTKCSRCEDLREQMEECISNERVLSVLVSQRKEHLRMIATERRGYATRRNRAIMHPSQCYSIIVDGADQKSYGLPHFQFSTKADRGHKIKVKCVGILEHMKEKRLSLFAMTPEFESGANHVIEAVHRVVSKRKQSQGKLPPVFYVQVDNCCRENKNRYFLSYLEMLVSMGVFMEVQVSFLPVGHTHTDIDQSFSSVASYLRKHKALTMSELLQSFRECYSPRATASEITKVINYSGLCEGTSCLSHPLPFSHFRYFRFFRAAENKDAPLFTTECETKVQSVDEWQSLKTTESRSSFFRTLPDIRQTPALRTSPPDNVTEVNRHLDSVCERVRSRQKMNQLYALKDKIYTERVIPFHWNLRTAFEMNGDYKNSTDEQESAVEEAGEIHARDELEYEENSFVAVRTDPREPSRFWIARILREEDDQLYIRWYITGEGSQDEFQSRYEPATVLEDPSDPQSEHVPYYATIQKSTVVVYFADLTRGSRLYCNTKTAIRQALNLS